MNHFLPVAVHHHFCQFLHDCGCLLLVKSAALLQLLVELPSGGILQNQVDLSMVT